MITVEEKHIESEIYFVVTDTNDNNFENVIRFTSGTSKVNEILYFLIYYPTMDIQYESFVFVNLYCAKHSANSKSKYTYALKLLFCYEMIINKNLNQFTKKDIDTLKAFLHGISYHGNTMKFNLITKRSNKTVNDYLSIYRLYLEFSGVKDHILFGRDALHYNPVDNKNPFPKMSKYRTNEKLPNKTTEVPMYISIDEYGKIIKHIRAHYSLRDEIICRLMYECGLRIGEVLGLTNEDVQIRFNSDTGETNYIITIRNRLTDSRDQCAKQCLKIYSVEQYKLPEYRTKSIGYQEVYCSESLYNAITRYIETAHPDEENATDKYFKLSFADHVIDDEDFEDNFYIFLNERVLTPISGKSWNTHLRKIFDEVGIQKDEGVRKHNLNHRFRHGFAMFHVQYRNVGRLELMRLLRHKGISSVECYYNPTREDIIEMQEQHQEVLINKLLPGLDLDYVYPQ